MPYARRYKRYRKYLKSRGSRRKPVYGSRLRRGSRYRMYRRNKRSVAQKHRLGSLFAPKIAGIGNRKSTILRGYTAGQITLPATVDWVPLKTDYQGLPRYHPTWFWDPFNEYSGAANLVNNNPMDGAGIMKDNFNHGETKNVYWKMRVTNPSDLGILRMFVIVTDAYTVINKITNGDQLIGGATNGKMYEVGPGKTKVIKIKFSPTAWAKFRHENPTNSRVIMGPDSITDRTNFSKPVYEPYIQVWCQNASEQSSTSRKFAYTIWQWSKMLFYNRRTNYIIEDELADGPLDQNTFDPENEVFTNYTDDSALFNKQNEETKTLPNP